jgi:hypothetical protein
MSGPARGPTRAGPARELLRRKSSMTKSRLAERLEPVGTQQSEQDDEILAVMSAS